MKNYKNPKIIIIQCNQDFITTSAGADAEMNERDDVAGFEALFETN